MNILVTGGAGFIASNFIIYMLDKYKDYKIINVDLLTYAGNLDNLKKIENNKNYRFIKGDIRDKEKMNDIFLNNSINSVVNFAAETHVDRSISDPDVFFTTNVIGTQVLLEIIRKQNNNIKFIQISTDEVYGSKSQGLFNEESKILANSPYSASKASADMIVRAYNKTYNLDVNITRSTNNYGPNQYPEKLIPLMISNALLDKELPVYGDGKQVRDWIHVLDNASAIDAVLHKGISGEVYNIGCNNEKTNIEIIKTILNILNKPESLIKYVKDRAGHDRRYAIDNTKITKELGWAPKYTFNQGLKDTVNLYKNHLK